MRTSTFTLLTIVVSLASNAFAFTPLEELRFKAKEAARFCAPLEADARRWRGRDSKSKIPANQVGRALTYLGACDIFTNDFEPADDTRVQAALKTNEEDAMTAAQAAYGGCWSACFAIGKALFRSKSILSKLQIGDLNAKAGAIVRKPKFPSRYTADFQQSFIEEGSKAKVFTVSTDTLKELEAVLVKMKAIDEKQAQREAELVGKPEGVGDATVAPFYAIRADTYRALAPLMLKLNESTAKSVR